MEVRHEDLLYWNQQAIGRLRSINGPGRSASQFSGFCRHLSYQRGVGPPNPDFPIRSDEACITVRLSGIEAVTRKFIAELLIFNENKRYEVKQNTQAVSTLFSMKPAVDGYWITELPDARKRFWFRQKITYFLTIIDPLTIEIRNNARRAKFVKCSPRGKLAI